MSPCKSRHVHPHTHEHSRYSSTHGHNKTRKQSSSCLTHAGCGLGDSSLSLRKAWLMSEASGSGGFGLQHSWGTEWLWHYSGIRGMLHIDIENKSTYSNNSLSHILQQRERKQQMEGNNWGRHRRVPCECFCPPAQPTAHTHTYTPCQCTHLYTCIHTYRCNTQPLNRNKWSIWLRGLRPELQKKRKEKKHTREKQDRHIWKAERDRRKERRETEDEKGRKKMREQKCEKESRSDFQLVKKGVRPCYKFSGPALDLIWAGMQTTCRPSLNRVLRVCVCGRLKDWLPGRFWHIGPHSLLPSV